MHKVLASSFDRELCKQEGFYRVVSVFNSTINLQNQSDKCELLAITSKDGLPNGIVIELDSCRSYFSKGVGFELANNFLVGAGLSIELEPSKARDFKLDRASIALDFLEANLENFLATASSQGLAQVLGQGQCSSLNQFLKQKIQEADEGELSLNGFCHAMVALYSAGLGSTPSMDDAILGMLIMAMAYGDDTAIFASPDGYANTTLISRAMLLNALQGRFADNVCQLYQNRDYNKIKNLADKIGSSSGIDMLVGSYFYLKKRGGRLCLKN